MTFDDKRFMGRVLRREVRQKVRPGVPHVRERGDLKKRRRNKCKTSQEEGKKKKCALRSHGGRETKEREY